MLKSNPRAVRALDCLPTTCRKFSSAASKRPCWRLICPLIVAIVHGGASNRVCCAGCGRKFALDINALDRCGARELGGGRTGEAASTVLAVGGVPSTVLRCRASETLASKPTLEIPRGLGCGDGSRELSEIEAMCAGGHECSAEVAA